MQSLVDQISMFFISLIIFGRATEVLIILCEFS